MKRSLRYRSFVVMLALSLVLAGCGGSSSDSSFTGLGGPSGSQVGAGNGPVGFGPGTGTPGVFAPPTTPPPYNPDTDAELVSISASPNPLLVYIANTAQLTVTGLLDDGTTVTLVNSSEVSLSFSTVATTAAIVSPTGLVTGIWFGSETVAVTAVIDGVTRTTAVPVTVSYFTSERLTDPRFTEPLDTLWLRVFPNVVTVGPDTYPLVEVRTSFDPATLPSLEGIRFLYVEAPSDSQGGISQTITLPSLAADQALHLRFGAVAKLNPVNVTAEVHGSTTVGWTVSPPSLYSAPLMPSGENELTYYQIDVSALAGETVEVRILASSPALPGSPGDTSVAISDLTLVVWPTAPYNPGTVVGG